MFLKELFCLYNRVRVFDLKVYEFLKEKYEKIRINLKNKYGLYYPKNIKLYLEGIEKEERVLEYLIEKDFLFLKSPSDILENEVLIREYIDLSTNLLKLNVSNYKLLENSVRFYYKAIELGKKLNISWKKIYLKNLKGFPDFTIIIPKFDEIILRYLEVKRNRNIII